MRVLSLFSGGGLGDYGLTLAGMEIVGQVEIDDYCQKILALRWPDVPKWRDIREVKGKEIIERCGRIDLVAGGFPCQDISIAGKHTGIKGNRSWLWKEMFRIICEVRPKYVFVENVAEILSRGMGVVLADLASCGFYIEWHCLPAYLFGLPHTRSRVWIIGNAQDNGREHAVNAPCDGLFEKGFIKEIPAAGGIVSNKERFLSKVRAAEFVRGSDGTSNRMDRIRMCGNGQVVQVVEWIGRQIMKAEARESLGGENG